MPSDETVIALLIGDAATEEAAAQVASRFSGCPHAAMYQQAD